MYNIIFLICLLLFYLNLNGYCDDSDIINFKSPKLDDEVFDLEKADKSQSSNEDILTGEDSNNISKYFDENLDVKEISNIRYYLNKLPFKTEGFFELRSGLRLQNDGRQSKDIIMSEFRTNLEIYKSYKTFEIKIKSDFYYDAYLEQFHTDLREANISFTPVKWMDIKIGRQILTWGVGDCLFINDLFPKDWKSFLMGRDEIYFKSPSNSIKLTFFLSFLNIDFIYNPLYNSNDYIEGERLSFWDTMNNTHSGYKTQIKVENLNHWFKQDEIFVRLFKNIDGYEISLYLYNGYWKDPTGYNEMKKKMIFCDLGVYGFSLRNEFLSGILSLEAGYYDSKEDRNGKNPNIMNSQAIFLIGYEKEICKDFTAGMQYYLEYLLNYDSYKNNLAKEQNVKDEMRHVLTLRLTYLMLNQNLTLSFFSYFSPSDVDCLIKPLIKYKITDDWLIDFGAHIFIGKEKYTFFSQFKKNTSVFLGIKFSF